MNAELRSRATASSSGSSIRSPSACDNRIQNQACPTRYVRSSTGRVIPRRTTPRTYSAASTGTTSASAPAPSLSSRITWSTFASVLARVSSRSSSSSFPASSGIVT